ncbi:MAG TPA: tetratricopeptide repeat protein [Myxococcota bacterium]|nr:tetratricopeptide repeat protein [Myxococcota bacterium]HRY95024.1 tetratricopeptide repeat protein [Myxococcota bacterium]
MRTLGLHLLFGCSLACLGAWLPLVAGAEEPAPAAATEPAAAPAAPEAAAPGAPTGDEERELQEMLSIVEDFNEQSTAFKKEIQLIIERKYDEQREAAVSTYTRVIVELEGQEIVRRDEAIEVFERFLAKYPVDPSYTPGALWRLAELHYERSARELALAETEFEKQFQAFTRGELKKEPLPPTPHFERTVALLQQLLRDFPTYKLNDGAQYLLAYCLQEQGEAEESEKAWLSFAARYPQSKLLPEVYTRLGELYFDDPDKQELAIEAYRKVLAYPQSRMFDKALYKLAWAYYKVDRFQEAVERFDELIAWADQEVEEETLSRKELRKEAMLYLAISFADDEWPGAGVENAKAFFASRGGRKYDGEFFRQLAEVYFVDARYDLNVKAVREAIERYPLHADNPKLMAAMIDSYGRLHLQDEATAAQEEMVKRFGPGSAWWQANQDKPEVIGEADQLAQDALYRAAVFHHLQAQKLSAEEQPEEKRRQYAMAADGYRGFLERFPQARDVYELTYYLADCYYYSLQFGPAAEAYARVRDSSAGTKFLAESANAVVLSYLNLIKAEEEAGRLAPLTIYTSANRPKELAVTPRDIPELRGKLVEACDTYVARLPADEQVDDLAFRAANVFYAFDHLDEARERLARIVASTRKDALATSSINLIIESYLFTQDWPQVETWSRKLASLTRDPQMKKSLKAYELGARFKKAAGFMQEGTKLLEGDKPEEANKQLEAAAQEFVRLVDDDPRGEVSDKALNNAALCYTRASRPMAAGEIYERIVREYPRSDFADKALFLMATSAEASYQYDRAIDNFLKLVDAYPDSEHRADALYNAAVALEGDQQYRRAAQAYERYAKLFKDRPDASENFFRGGQMLERQKDWREVIAIYQRYMQAYRNDAASGERLVEAQMKIAEAQEALGDHRKALQTYAAVIKMFLSAKLPGGGRAAEAAAKAHFLTVEEALKGFEKITFAVAPRLLEKTLKNKAETLKKLEDRYKATFNFKRVQWTLAAYFRLGYLYENFADVLVNSPCPAGLNEEECDLYKGKLEDLAEQPIKKAVTAYVETMAKAKEFKVANAWTQMALESLNRFEPLQYPLQKRPEADLVMDRHGAEPLIQVVDSGVKPEGK